MNLLAMKRQAVPLHAEVAAVMRHQIMSGAISPGERLPALSELTAKLGVARMTVKQAMDALEEEGLIERHSGRGTFVRDVRVPEKLTVNMRASFSELQSMVSQLEVTVLGSHEAERYLEVNGVSYLGMKRLHSKNNEPFCVAEIFLDKCIYERAPARFASEIVVRVLSDLGVPISSARQRVTISYADFEIAQTLRIPVNSAVFNVFREFFDPSNKLIYSANLIYPGDKLAFDIEFSGPPMSPQDL